MRRSRFGVLWFGLIGLGALVAACGGSRGAAEAPAAAPAPAATVAAATPAPAAAPPAWADYQKYVDAAERDPNDKKLDAGRHPAEMLAFFGIKPGMKVAELGAGMGYTAELLARVVGESGQVYGQNSQFLLDRFAQEPWTTRLQKPVMKHVTRLDRPFDDPFPPEVKDLDVVVINLFYHDTVWQKVDRDKMNRAVWAALRPGGTYAIVDHNGRPGTGMTETETLHRIEESALKADVEKAGFVLAAEGNFLRNPQDSMDWSASPRTAGEKRGTSDRFVLGYKKP